MKDKNGSLKIGDRIGDYEIGECIGSGGSAHCYEAYDTNGGCKVIIKEMRDDEQKFMQRTETKIIQKIRDSKGKNTSYILYSKILVDGGRQYAVIETAGGEMFKDMLPKLKSLEDLLAVVSRILEALDPIHRAGYIHGDIAPDNLYVTDLMQDNKESCRTILCIDFNSSFKLENVKKRKVSCKEGYTAPELRSNSQISKIGFGSDLYSVAAILFKMLFGEKFNLTQHESLISGDFKDKIQKNNPYLVNETGEVVENVITLLYNALVKRFDSVSDFQAAIKEITYLMANKQRLVHKFFANNVEPVGRDEILAGMAADLDKHKTVALWGIGGIGKSFIARSYAFANKEKYKTIIDVKFHGSIRETIIDDIGFPITNYDMDIALVGVEYKPEEKLQKYFEEKIKKLQSLLSDDVLLIIDGMDLQIDDDSKTKPKKKSEGKLEEQFEEDVKENFRHLLSLNCHKIITTRFNYEQNPNVLAKEIEELSLSDAMQLFEKYCTVKESSKNVVEELLEAVKYHTLAVELIAKSITRSHIKLELLLDNLKTVQANTYPVEKVKATINGVPYNNDIDTIFQTIFDTSEMKVLEKEILCHLSLFPDMGFDMKLFKEWMEQSDYNAINSLIDSGWIQENQAQEQISLHNVISDVIFKTLKPTEEKCPKFLDNAKKWIEKNADHTNENGEYFRYYELEQHLVTNLSHACQRVMHPQHRILHIALDLTDMARENVLYEQAMDIVLFALRLSVDLYGENSRELSVGYERIGSTYGDLGDYEKALEYHLKAFMTRKTVLPSNHPDFVSSYNNTGGIYFKLGEYEKALEYMLKAMEIWESVLPANHPKLATSYNNIGLIYGELGDHEKALEYQLKALDIREDVLPSNHPDLTMSYNNMGSIYGKLGDHEKALEYQVKALEIRMVILPSNHPNLASSYNNVGGVYSELGAYEKALGYMLKAMEIWESVLPFNHQYLAKGYSNVGSTYGDLGDHLKALEYKMKSLFIFEDILRPNHPDLVETYICIVITYGDLGEPGKAIEYMLKAMEIQESVLPSNHLDLATSYNTIGAFYGYLGELGKALEYMLKALAIREDILPSNHPDLIVSYNQVAIIYGDLGDLEKALEYELKALGIFEEVLPSYYPDLAISYNNAGYSYDVLGENDKALEYRLKALEVRDIVLPANHPDLIKSYNNVSAAYDELGNHKKALKYKSKAMGHGALSVNPIVKLWRKILNFF